MRVDRYRFHSQRATVWSVLLIVWLVYPQEIGAQAEASDNRWLLFWTAVRPSRAVAFEADWKQDLVLLRGDGISVLTLVSTSQAYTFLTPLSAGEGTEAALRLGPPKPLPPTGSAIHQGTAGTRTWVVATVHGGPPMTAPADPRAHLGLWFVEPAMTVEAERRLRAWAREAKGTWLLRVVDGPDLPLWVSISVGDGAARRGADLAGLLAPVLRASLPAVAFLRSDLSSSASAIATETKPSAVPSPMEPIEPLPYPHASRDQTAVDPERAFGRRIAEAARESVRRAPTYDTSYSVLPFPGGDPGWQQGSSVDVIIRALRAVGIDLQERVHRDLVAYPGAYGAIGRSPDTNIDHRRLRNILTFLERHAQHLPTEMEGDWRPGDIVIWDSFGDGIGDHLGIVTTGSDGSPWVIHHHRPEAPFSGNPDEEPVLGFWPRVGHYRLHANEGAPEDEP